MRPTTTGRSPLASLALRIGETITIRSLDGWSVQVRLVDVRMSYGKLQAAVIQDAGPRGTGALQWIDAERVR